MLRVVSLTGETPRDHPPTITQGEQIPVTCDDSGLNDDCLNVIRLRSEVVRPAIGALVVSIIGVATASRWVDWPALGRWLWPHAGQLVAFGLAGVFLATSVSRAWRPSLTRRQNGRVLRWWIVLAAAAVVAGVAWIATKWLLHEADQARDPAAARVEAIKTGLSIGAGAGGVFALLLAVRRQWHQEISASATELDAAEKRITELYAKAADQLGSDKAPVRLAGLYALERVAQNNPDQRQTIVNVLCAYLRMPYDPPSEPPAEDADEKIIAAHRERVQEREVRLAAQQVIASHLRPGDEPRRSVETFWEEIDLDLNSATLINLDLSDCRTRSAQFERATFLGETVFNGAILVDARFSNTRFRGAVTLRHSYFIGATEFRAAQFAEHAWLDNATFYGKVTFANARFDGLGSFRGAKFMDQSWFDKAHFAQAAEFRGTQFSDVSFSDLQFSETAEFREARFTGWARFERAIFSNTVWFKEVEFLTTADFRQAQFGGNARFDKAKFWWNVRLDGASFTQKASFDDATFIIWASPTPHLETLIRSIWGTTFTQGEPEELKDFTRYEVG